MAERILIVEDEITPQGTLSITLKRYGYLVETVEGGDAALVAIRDHQPELIILNIMLPKLDSLEICSILRQETNIPILLITDNDTKIDSVIGLEMGADDYITKPFSLREFLARIKALLRRVRMIREEINREEKLGREVIYLGDLSLNLTRREVFKNHELILLKPKEFDLLLYFSRHRGKNLSRETILNEVWGWEYSGGSRTVDVHVRWLREKIEENPANPCLLITVRGIGYRFEGDV